ncbi:lipocalin-like domain-containing protein [Bradyrhizobium sp. SYSU BS000235]|uniref:lipocalin-like domain-containing protein n=1 Tax=Bradyrhizobium sp. SYSU BS000235 TaxID=3411332 RepID=UPI003C777991
MSVDLQISRRAFLGGSLLVPFASTFARAQGFAGLGGASDGFASVVPGKALEFPRDLGPHPDYRIEWWYLTANLKDANGTQWGVQWTLFRQAMSPGAEQAGWDNRQLWMGHAAVTNAQTHRFAERFARGGVGQAGAQAVPFQAWIDSWKMGAADGFAAHSVAPLALSASGNSFSYALTLEADQPLVLQGNGGYSKKSERGQASYYFSQPYYKAKGSVTLDDKTVQVDGLAWMDREWSSQPLASDQTGWDWFSLHLESGVKVMLFRLRQKDGGPYFAGNWIDRSGHSEVLPANAIEMTPAGFTDIEGRKLPTSWTIVLRDRGLKIESAPLNPKSWMGTRYSYWEGPIVFKGSQSGMGYLEMTGY